MAYFFGIDWLGVFRPETPLLEIFLRGTFVYLALVLMLRFVLRRESGSMAISDLLVIVLLADAAQNAMAGDYTTVTDGLLLVATIIFWAYSLDWLSYRWRPLQRVLRPRARLLVKDGAIIRPNLRKEFITEDELMAALREQGVPAVDEVQAAYIEADGRISVIGMEPG